MTACLSGFTDRSSTSQSSLPTQTSISQKISRQLARKSSRECSGKASDELFVSGAGNSDAKNIRDVNLRTIQRTSTHRGEGCWSKSRNSDRCELADLHKMQIKGEGGGPKFRYY